MELNQYQKLAYRTANHKLPDEQQLQCAAMGLAGEAGEFCDRVKKIVFHSHPFTEEERRKLQEEAGDILWYVALAATALDVSLNDMAQGNIEKLARRYPEVFTPELSLNRKETVAG